MSLTERVSTEQASKELGMTKRAIIDRIADGSLPIGYVQESRNGGKRTPYIYRHLLDEYMGKGCENPDSTEFRNRLFYATCVFSGILHEIQKEIKDGEKSRLDEFMYCVKQYEEQYDVSTSILWDSIEKYRDVLKERCA